MNQGDINTVGGGGLVGKLFMVVCLIRLSVSKIYFLPGENSKKEK